MNPEPREILAAHGLDAERLRDRADELLRPLGRLEDLKHHEAHGCDPTPARGSCSS